MGSIKNYNTLSISAQTLADKFLLCKTSLFITILQTAYEFCRKEACHQIQQIQEAAISIVMQGHAVCYFYTVSHSTLVTQHFSRARIFRQKCWNRTFIFIIYLLTYFLFDGIEKNRNHPCESFCFVKGTF